MDFNKNCYPLIQKYAKFKFKEWKTVKFCFVFILTYDALFYRFLDHQSLREDPKNGVS